MNTVFFSLLFAATLLVQPVKSPAQEAGTRQQVPAWVSAKGYWVVQSNERTPRNAVVYFYNNDNLLVYTKAFQNQKLNLKKSKTLVQLKTTLEDAVAAYQNGVAANRRRSTPAVWQE